MTLTRGEVERVAALARLRLTPDEQTRLTDQLDKILEYMAQLNELDTSQVEPIAHVVDIVNALREDRVTSQPNADALLANAPAREDNFFRVPKIIE
jgi:aspartyl-tRNA(Asn)/glutamyl-tRNA(Gln) amidotransferase subunit C